MRTMLQTNKGIGRNRILGATMSACLALVLVVAGGCRSKAQKHDDGFFTSGSRDADQRASQRMAKAEQLAGSGENAGEKGAKKADPKAGASGQSSGTNKAAQVEGKLSLFDRLGGQEGISRIVEDFTPRVMQDPRVNWPRNGVNKRGFSLKGDRAVTWNARPENIVLLKKHMVQFLSLATGGPPTYEGKSIKSAHGDMRITNPEFDAAIGDVKASLDKLQVPNKEQKELLAIIESTRPEIVTVR